MEIIQGKEVTHKNKHYDNGVKFHKKENGDFLYFSNTYEKWMDNELTPRNKLVPVNQ